MSEGNTEADDNFCPYTIGSFHGIKGVILDWLWRDDYFIAIYLDGNNLSRHSCTCECNKENEKKVRRLLSRRWIAFKALEAVRYVAGEDQVPVAGNGSDRYGE